LQRQKQRQQLSAARRIAGEFALADRRQPRIGQDDEVAQDGCAPAHLADRRGAERATDIDADE